MTRPDLSTVTLRRHFDTRLPLPAGDFWVFGYGSLMWDPGFDFTQHQPAVLYGYHRRLCLWSIHFRGTLQRPGLVLGIARGGSCRGMAFKVRGDQADPVRQYLQQREMLSDAYLPAIKPIYFDRRPPVEALTFISKPQHPQYAAAMSDQQIIEVVGAARGERGSNREYVLNTATLLSRVGVRNTTLHRIAARLGPE